MLTEEKKVVASVRIPCLGMMQRAFNVSDRPWWIHIAEQATYVGDIDAFNQSRMEWDHH
jgi:hypothetical protein